MKYMFAAVSFMSGIKSDFKINGKGRVDRRALALTTIRKPRFPGACLLVGNGYDKRALIIVNVEIFFVFFDGKVLMAF